MTIQLHMYIFKKILMSGLNIFIQKSKTSIQYFRT